MKEAVIVSTARTPIGRAFRGSFNNTKSPSLMAHALRHALNRSTLVPELVDDVVVGSAIAGRDIRHESGPPSGPRCWSLGTSVAGQTIDRQCASGLMAIATGAKL